MSKPPLSDMGTGCPIPLYGASLTSNSQEVTETTALLVDEELADLVWEAWNVGEIDDLAACWTWWAIVIEAA